MNLSGSCLCGNVRYQLADTMNVFQYCHCSRCRKFTGSAHASNLFVKPDDFQWLQGREFVGRYEPGDTKYFATCFCKQCGSSLPWHNKKNSLVIVPAGTLDKDPGIRPDRNIYWESRAAWYECSGDLEKFAELPVRN